MKDKDKNMQSGLFKTMRKKSYLTHLVKQKQKSYSVYKKDEERMNTVNKELMKEFENMLEEKEQIAKEEFRGQFVYVSKISVKRYNQLREQGYIVILK